MRVDIRTWLGVVLAATFGALAIHDWHSGTWSRALVDLGLGFTFVGLAVRGRHTI